MIAGVFQQILDKSRVIPDRNEFFFRAVARDEKAFQNVLAVSGVGTNVGNDGQIDRQPALEKRPVEAFEKSDWGQCVGIVVSQDNVTHIRLGLPNTFVVSI